MKLVQDFAEKLITNIEKVIIGKRQTVEMAVIGLLCEGHLLIEDVPGVGKTMLARSMAKSLGCTFRRIQFTPDMLPSDVTGVSVFNQVSREFEFRPGPVMAQVVLADEINRATPKTQAALLEAMEERQITVEGITHTLPTPFLVLATQNPIEYEGTFPLPEAQLDRFLFRIGLGYPSDTEEIRIMENQQQAHPIAGLEAVVGPEEIAAAQAAVRQVFISEAVKRYIVELVRATRQHPDTYLGASPRGSLALYRGGQARAAVQGREYVLPDDIKALAEAALAHRIILTPAARLGDVTAEQVVGEILESTPIPGGTLPAE